MCVYVLTVYIDLKENLRIGERIVKRHRRAKDRKASNF